MLNADLKRKNKFSAKEPQNLAAAPAPAPLPACSLPPVPALGQQRAGSGTWQSRVIKNDRERGRGFPKGSGALLPVPPEWACTTALGGVTPIEGGLESDSSSQMGQKWGLERDSPAWPCRGSPHLLGCHCGTRDPGCQLAPAMPLRQAPGRGLRGWDRWAGGKEPLSAAVLFSTERPTGRASPSPDPSPIPAPCAGAGSNALVYDLLGHKRGLLAAASNWCTGTTVTICLVGRWRGRGRAGSGVLFLLSCTTKLCTFCFPEKSRELGRKRPLCHAGQGRARSAHRGVHMRFLLNIVIVIIVI